MLCVQEPGGFVEHNHKGIAGQLLRDSTNHAIFTKVNYTYEKILVLLLHTLSFLNMLLKWIFLQCKLFIKMYKHSWKAFLFQTNISVLRFAKVCKQYKLRQSDYEMEWSE